MAKAIAALRESVPCTAKEKRQRSAPAYYHLGKRRVINLNDFIPRTLAAFTLSAKSPPSRVDVFSLSLVRGLDE